MNTFLKILLSIILLLFIFLLVVFSLKVLGFSLVSNKVVKGQDIVIAEDVDRLVDTTLNLNSSNDEKTELEATKEFMHSYIDFIYDMAEISY